jgi:hypothetical protein
MNTKRRAGVAALLTGIIAPLVAFGGVAPAQADTPPAFEIFYGQNCSRGQTASRIYSGYNAGEAWINDTFTSSQYGSAGYGQPIRNNAASIYVSHAMVRLTTPSNYPVWVARAVGACYNLPDNVRNSNTNWTTYSYGGSVNNDNPVWQ